MSMTWSGKAGVAYQVQISSDLKTWADAPMGAFSGTGAVLTYVDAGAGSVKTRYYRLVVR